MKTESIQNPTQIGNGRSTPRIAHDVAARALGQAAVVMVVLAVLSSMVHAQEPEGDTRHWIGGAAGTATIGDDRCNPELYFVRKDGVCDDRDFGYKAYAGRALNDFLAAEVSLARLGEGFFQTTEYIREIGFTEITLTGRHNVSVGAAAMLLIPIRRLDAFLKIGPQWWSRDIVYQDEEFDANTAGFDLAWGLGARYRISNRFSVRAEVERFVIDDFDLNFVSVGLAWHF